MSPSIQIRNVPADIHKALRTRAATVGMSLSDYLLEEIVRVAERPAVGDVLARAATRRTGAPGEVIVAAVRSGRDRSP